MDIMVFKTEIKNRGITRLCHLTRSQKAVHILTSETGIKAVDFLEKDIYDVNDPQRLDGKKDFVNCSIQYPNHWYWRKVKDKDPLFKEWVILFINPELLLLDTTEFCAVNAATDYGAHIKKGYGAFQGLYSNTLNIKRLRHRTDLMLPCCPTDDQAEVLIYKNISRHDIIGAAVPSEEQAKEEYVRWYYNLKDVPPLGIVIAPDLFNGDWSKKVRRGMAPLEFRYEGGD
jgi:hypothetical protein